MHPQVEAIYRQAWTLTATLWGMGINPTHRVASPAWEAFRKGDWSDVEDSLLSIQRMRSRRAAR